MKHPVDVHVGKRVRHRRWMVGMTQQQLGDIVGIKFQQIQKYETGMNRISASRLWDIAQALDVSISFFFEGFEGEAGSAAATAGDDAGARRPARRQGGAGAGALLLRDPGGAAPPAVRSGPRPQRRRLIQEAVGAAAPAVAPPRALRPPRRPPHGRVCAGTLRQEARRSGARRLDGISGALHEDFVAARPPARSLALRASGATARGSPPARPRPRRFRAAPAPAASGSGPAASRAVSRSAAAGPADARAAERQLRVARQLAPGTSRRAPDRRSARCRRSGGTAAGRPRVPGHPPVAEADPAGHRGQRRRRPARRRPQVQPPHRRREDRAVEVPPLDQRPQRDAAAHRMRHEIAAAPAGSSAAASASSAGDVVLIVGEVARRGRASRCAGAGPTAPGRASRSPRPRSRAPTSSAATGRTSRQTRCGPGKITAVPRAAAPPDHRPQPRAVRGASATSLRRPPARRRRRHGTARRGSSEQAAELHREPHVALDPELAAHEGRGRVELARRAGPERVGAGGQRAVGVAVVGRGARSRRCAPRPRPRSRT